MTETDPVIYNQQKIYHFKTRNEELNENSIRNQSIIKKNKTKKLNNGMITNSKIIEEQKKKIKSLFLFY
jgi:hypothetical protein